MKINIGSSLLSLIKGDITQQETEAIVNAANSGLVGGGGVDGAIHRAGGPAILTECKVIRAQQGPLPPGKAVLTGGGYLKAKYVIHTVGPVWHGGNEGEENILSSAYRESLNLAVSREIKSISFPSISTGAYGYPVDKAASVALKTVIDILKEEKSSLIVIFVLFNEHALKLHENVLRKMVNLESG